MALASVVSQVCEVCFSGLAVKVVKDYNAFTASKTRGSGYLRHFDKSVVFTQGLVRPGLLLKAHPDVWMPRRTLLG